MSAVRNVRAKRRRRLIGIPRRHRPRGPVGAAGGMAHATIRTTGMASTTAAGVATARAGTRSAVSIPGSPSTAPRIAYADSPTAVAPADATSGNHHELRTSPRVARPVP